MYVMQPVWQFLAQLDGFETSALYIAGFTLIIIFGFLVDYIMQKQAFGVLFNSVLVAIGLALGLFVRFAYATPMRVPLPDPMLSISVILGTTILLITLLSLLRNRFG